MSTPNMGLSYPADHTDDDTWGLALNAVFDVIDAHDHTTGKGVPVPSAALEINADVSWSFGGTNYALKDALAIDLNPTAPANVTSYSSALFSNSSDSNNLYYRNSSGVNVQITSGSTLNISIVGGIGGDYSSVGALLSYDDATRRYLLQQEGSPRPWAGLGTADIDLYQKAASISNKVTLKSPSALAASYAVTWLAALPASQVLMQINNTGIMSASNALANNASLFLSGTGKIAHATRHLVLPAYKNAFDVNGGTISTTGGSPGAVFATSTTGYFPIPCIDSWMTIDKIVVWFAAAPANSVTVSGWFTSTSTPPGSTYTDTTVSASGTTASLTLDFTGGGGLTLPVGMAETFFVKIVTGVTTGCIVASFDIQYHSA